LFPGSFSFSSSSSSSIPPAVSNVEFIHFTKSGVASLFRSGYATPTLQILMSALPDPNPGPPGLNDTAEGRRLSAANAGKESWRRWGPYLSERQWGTVREDYSSDGTAWDYFPHDHARSRAYRWGEDGLAGISDERSRLCLALALWNGKDPILKERLFGLTNSEGNHGEAVKVLD
jgi:hypothetical protein